jgi:hypothetical protein
VDGERLSDDAGVPRLRFHPERHDHASLDLENLERLDPKPLRDLPYALEQAAYLVDSAVASGKNHEAGAEHAQQQGRIPEILRLVDLDLRVEAVEQWLDLTVVERVVEGAKRLDVLL